MSGPIEAPSVNQALTEARARRRRLQEFEETQRWLHHVADLDSGEVRTTTLDRPIAPLPRTERLSQLGHRFDPTLLGGPSYRLTPRQPYQASPEAWLTVVNFRDYSTGSDGEVIWHVEGGQSGPGAAFFSFAEPPDRRSLASISLAAVGQGHLRVSATGIAPGIEVPVDATFGTHTVDLIFVPPPDVSPTVIMLDLFEGIEWLVFRAISFGAAEPVFEG